MSRGVNLAACAGPQTTLVRSTSGGTDWRTIASLPTFRPVALLNTAGAGGTPVFWALGGRALLRSTDGGAQWAQVLPAPVPTAAIQFLTANEGWGVGTLFDPGAILETIDGGRTWSVVFSVPGAALSDISFPNSSNGWVAGATQPWDPQSGQGLLWRTTDGGQSWSVVTATMRLPALPTIAFSGGGRGSLITPGADIACFSACPAADVFATTDGGKLWRSVVPVVHPGGLTAVDITPAGTFWGLWRTSGGCNLVLARSTAAASGWTVPSPKQTAADASGVTAARNIACRRRAGHRHHLACGAFGLGGALPASVPYRKVRHPSGPCWEAAGPATCRAALRNSRTCSPRSGVLPVPSLPP